MDHLVLILAIVFGAVTVFGFKLDEGRHIKVMTAFAGGFLITLTVLHLLPELYVADLHGHGHDGHDHGPAKPSHLLLGALILIGFFLQVGLDTISMGVEHGHSHQHSHHDHKDHSGPCGFPWGVMVGLCLHALVEAVALGDHHHHHDQRSRSFMLWSIVIHKYPAAVALLGMLMQAGMKRSRSLVCLAIFGAMAPIGLLIGSKTHLVDYSRELTAFVIGIFLHIATTILFESSESHRFNGVKAVAIAVGVGLGVAAVLVH
ncbi:MAG: ZIP family metal transporter [Limisphaerales bacterium]